MHRRLHRFPRHRPAPPSCPRAYARGSRPGVEGDPFAGQSEISVERLVAEVEARNPSLEAAQAAWRAAAERYPQVISLEDPMFGFAVSPGGVGLEQNGGWMVEASQKLPWAGKRALRGEAADAEADAAGGECGDVRLQLALAAKMALADYYMAVRQAEVNRATDALLVEFRQIAKSKYEVAQATEQDVLQANVDLADLESRRAQIERDRRVAVARINTLLHRAADYPLPPPPARVAVAEALPDIESLRQSALQRPARPGGAAGPHPRGGSQPGVGLPGVLSRRGADGQVRCLHAGRHSAASGDEPQRAVAAGRRDAAVREARPAWPNAGPSIRTGSTRCNSRCRRPSTASHSSGK